MNRTLLPKEGIVAFSCGLAGKYIDDKNGPAEVLGLSEGWFLLRKFFRPILYKHPSLWCDGGCGGKDKTSVLVEDKPH